MSLESICKKDVVTTTRDQSVMEIARLMRDHSIGDVVVVDDENCPIGLVTDRDIVVGALAENMDRVGEIKVSDLMSDSVVCVTLQEPIKEVATKMRDHGVARLPVVDDDGRICGIVTSNHIFQKLNEEFSMLAGISTHHREASPAKKRQSSKEAKPLSSEPTQPILQ